MLVSDPFSLARDVHFNSGSCDSHARGDQTDVSKTWRGFREGVGEGLVRVVVRVVVRVSGGSMTCTYNGKVLCTVDTHTHAHTFLHDNSCHISSSGRITS